MIQNPMEIGSELAYKYTIEHALNCYCFQCRKQTHPESTPDFILDGITCTLPCLDNCQKYQEFKKLLEL